MMIKFDRDVSLQWHYFESNQGKAIVDGIAGTVTNAVFRRFEQESSYQVTWAIC